MSHYTGTSPVALPPASASVRALLALAAILITFAVLTFAGVFDGMTGTGSTSGKVFHTAPHHTTGGRLVPVGNR